VFGTLKGFKMEQSKRSFLRFLKRILSPYALPDLLYQYSERQLRSEITTALGEHDLIERNIINLLYGLGDGYSYQPEECCRVLKMSLELVLHNRKMIRRKIRRYVKVMYLDHQ